MSDLRAGVSVAGYRIEALLGSGSMGSVYSALDTELDRRVAIKVLLPELARDERFRARFLRESRLAAGLEHPNVVPVHRAGESDGRLYIAMRYVDGRDLAATLRSLGRLDPGRALDILAQVASALDAAHARGLVHRDVKPANILLAGDHVYLCDFGLAKHVSSVSSLSGERSIVGTVDYLAPEQIEGTPVDGRVDVYALGCVLFECLTGAPPHARDNELASLMAHVSESPPSVTDRHPDLPAGLDDVLATALARDREGRYATCGDMIAAARAALAGDTMNAPAAPRPTASLRTFLFADIRGYTSYTREHGDEAGAALAQSFAAIARELGPQHRGHLQELRGDEALLVFESPRRALRFAVELQRRVAAAALPRGVGVGLDAGEAVPVDDGYRGGALNRAARLCSLARAGEVLASEAVTELAGRSDGFAYGLRRLERLKGFDRPVRVVEVLADASTSRADRLRQLRRSLAGSRPRVRLAVLAAAALAVVAVALLVAGGDDGATPLEPDQIALLDAETLQPVSSISRLGAPDGVWRDPEGDVWTIDLAGRLLTRLDPKTRKVTTRIPLGDMDPNYPTWGDGSVWVGDAAASAVERFDPTYGTQIARIELPDDTDPFTNGIAYGAGSVWVAYGKWPFRLVRIDPARNRVAGTIKIPRADGQALLAFGGGALWVVSQETGRIWKVDPATDAVVAKGKVHDGWVEDVAFVDGSLWLPVQDDGAVWQVDSNAEVVRSIPTGSKPYTVGAGAGHELFVANQNSGTITRVDTRSGRTRSRSTGHMPNSAVLAGGLIWVSLSPSAADARRGLDPEKTVRLVTQGDPWFNTDPAIASPPEQFQLQRAIGARLLRVPDEGQPRQGELLPEIADLPKVSNGGRTFTFRIRPGHRFSPPSGAPVTAEVMRFSVERTLSPVLTGNNVDPSLAVTDLVGLGAYRKGRAQHVSGIRVRGDELSFTLKRPAPDFPARISLPWFSAVPLGTPVLPHGIPQALPSAGPYYVASHIGDTQEVLKRNPNYDGPRPHHVGAFLVSNDVDEERAVDLVVAGKADVTTVAPPQSSGGAPTAWQPGGELDRRYGRADGDSDDPRLINSPVPSVRFLAFNARRGLFRDPVLRRAVALALDREAMAAAGGERPWDSMIGVGMPGAPDAGAKVPAPDLTRAKALARGRGGRAVMFINTPDRCSECAARGAVVAKQLAPLGIDVKVKVDERAPGGFFDPDLPADLVLMGWIYDWPDPSNTLNAMFDRRRPLGYGFPVLDQLYDDPAAARRLRAAYRTSGAARDAAYRRADAQLLRTSAPVVPFARNDQPILVSPRVGCAGGLPQDYGQLNLAALCLR